MDDRLTAAQRGYGRRWQAYRDRYLKEHALCVMHMKQGRIVASTVVDHITPHRLGQAILSKNDEAINAARRLFWDPKNHQALCDTCHSSHKQRQEKSGKVVGCSDAGVPTDPNHHWN